MALGSRNDATDNRSSSEGSEEGERTDTSDDYSDQCSYESGNHNAQPTSTQSPSEESETTVSLNEESEQEGKRNHPKTHKCFCSYQIILNLFLLKCTGLSFLN